MVLGYQACCLLFLPGRMGRDAPQPEEAPALAPQAQALQGDADPLDVGFVWPDDQNDGSVPRAQAVLAWREEEPWIEGLPDVLGGAEAESVEPPGKRARNGELACGRPI